MGEQQMLRIFLSAAALIFASTAIAQETPGGARVEVNGMQMYYEVSGKGEPLVVLHGSQMSIPSMGEIIGRLAETHRVYALEAQGHGRTTDIDRPITYPNLAEDVAVFMDVMDIEKADVFGFSMGAITGLRLAIDHPEKVDQLIMASGVYDSDGWQPAYKEAIPKLKVEMFTSSFLAKDHAELSGNPDAFPVLMEKLIGLQQAPMDWGGELAAVKTPVLIIAGDADGMVLEHSVQMFRLLGGGAMGDTGGPLAASRLAILPASSHTAIIEQPDEMMDAIGPFLAGETPKGWFN
jgi:pimeloyl-ACP methyl ester carboxylesterase